MTLEVLLVDSLAAIGPELFGELDGPADYPFLRYEWLNAFELSGTLGHKNGWIPRHLVVQRRGHGSPEVLAVAPAYLKLHSMGEFVFDQVFAQFAEARLGINYYPKLVLAVPFTPATGPRVLLQTGLSLLERAEVFDHLTGALPELIARLGLSSAHVLFPDQSQSEELKSRGFAQRLGLQFQFKNPGHQTFEDYLATFSSKRRAAIRRERRAPEQQGLSITASTAEALGPDAPRLAYELYLTTVDKFAWGRRYLNQAFFDAVFTTMPEVIHLVLARQEVDGEVLAGAFNLLGKSALYGRYWGCFVDRPFLHFNVCLYKGVEETLSRGLASFEPGAGGEHKEGRGFKATVTESVHYFADARLDRAIRDYLLREAEAVLERARGGD